MKGSSNLFLVTSPFQLITAIEARDRFCAGEENHLLIFDRTPPGSLGARHLDALTGTGWSRIERLPIDGARGLARALNRLKITLRLARQRPLRRGKVFAGDYRVGWFRLIGRLFGESLTGLDDGAASIPMIAALRQKGLKGLHSNGMPHLFSVFATAEDTVQTAGAMINNPLESLAKRRYAGQIRHKGGLVFIGQVMRRSESEGDSQEFSLLADMLASCGGGMARYIPHRNEPAEKLQRIAALGYQVTPCDQPIELALLEAPELPETVISWFSTALFTLNLLFRDIRIVALAAPEASVGPQRQAEIALVYDALSANGIEVIRR